MGPAHQATHLQPELHGGVKEALGEHKLKSKNLHVRPVVEQAAGLDDDEQEREDKNTGETETKPEKNILSKNILFRDTIHKY